ncbi:MAG: hypothetical protein HRT88_16515 [Lentisphaeraceae bacterium]|nr:hypothetical protein [Lentisphaeraceae bacterium]
MKKLVLTFLLAGFALYVQPKVSFGNGNWECEFSPQGISLPVEHALCDLDGNTNVEQSLNIENKLFKKASGGNYSQKSSALAVYDGYASNKLHELHIQDGSHAGHIHGSKGMGLNKTKTAHGMTVDQGGNYDIAERGNKRLVWHQPDCTALLSSQNPQKHVQRATPSLEVCNVHCKDDFAVLPCLNSSIAFLKKSDKEECGDEIDSSFKMPAELIKQGYDGIHDINFSQDNKYLIVAVWQCNKKLVPILFALRRIHRKVK